MLSPRASNADAVTVHQADGKHYFVEPCIEQMTMKELLNNIKQSSGLSSCFFLDRSFSCRHLCFCRCSSPDSTSRESNRPDFRNNTLIRIQQWRHLLSPVSEWKPLHTQGARSLHKRIPSYSRRCPARCSLGQRGAWYVVIASQQSGLECISRGNHCLLNHVRSAP